MKKKKFNWSDPNLKWTFNLNDRENEGDKIILSKPDNESEFLYEYYIVKLEEKGILRDLKKKVEKHYNKKEKKSEDRTEKQKIATERNFLKMQLVGLNRKFDKNILTESERYHFAAIKDHLSSILAGFDESSKQKGLNINTKRWKKH